MCTADTQHREALLTQLAIWHSTPHATLAQCFNAVQDLYTLRYFFCQDSFQSRAWPLQYQCPPHLRYLTKKLAD